MTVEVELYAQPDYEPAGRLPLAPLLRDALEPILGRDLSGAQFLLHLSAVDDSEVMAGQPSLINVRGSHGYGTVTIFEAGRVVYQHPHALAEIVALPLQRLLGARFPEIEHWGFGLVGSGLEDLSLIRPTPLVPGSVPITASRQRRQAAHVEEVPDPEPPPATLSDLGVPAPREPYAGPPRGPDGSAPPAAVVLRPIAYSGLMERHFSSEVEEGGFLIGHHHRDAEHSQRYLLEVTAVVRAQSTGASLLRFTFTGESFLQLGNVLARRGGHEEILGWYHTHLFAASPEFGLSTIDVRLHTSTFRRPWQVAALVNLDADRRVLRWYGSEPGGELAEIPYWLATDETRQPPAPLPTGSES